MRYEIGKIATTHGIKGDLKIKSDTDFDRFKRGKSVYILMNDTRVDFLVRNVKVTENYYIVHFENLDDINLVEKYKGYTLYTDEAPVLEKNEYHISALIGLAVYNQKGELKGKIKDVIEVPQGHLLQVETPTKLALVPFIEVFIKTVDAFKVVIEEIEGLL